MFRFIFTVLLLALLSACATTSGQSAPSQGNESGSGSSGNMPNDPHSAPVGSGEDTSVSSEDPQTPVNNFAPRDSDKDLQRSPAFFEKGAFELLTMESYPPQFNLSITGSLPNPCHELRVQVAPPDKDNKIQLEIYSVVDPGMMCTEVLKEFQENINLGSFPEGHYEIYVNGEKVAEFDS